jgi:hypothetical protein
MPEAIDPVTAMPRLRETTTLARRSEPLDPMGHPCCDDLVKM